MSKPDFKPSSRRTLYQKFSDKVFAWTGMPVRRVVTAIAGLSILGWAIIYAISGKEEAVGVKSKVAKKKDFIEAISIPENFLSSPFPVQLEQIDTTIGRCKQLLNNKVEYSEYDDQLQLKLLTLFSLKSITLAANGMDPTGALDLFEKKFNQIASSSAQPDEHQYLAASTYLRVLEADPKLDFYEQLTRAINGIEKTTPVPRTQAIASFKAATAYHEAVKDKAKSAKLLEMLGERMMKAKDVEVADFGACLMDFPNFFSSYKGSIDASKFGVGLDAEADKFLAQLDETPPQSWQSYNVLLNIPEECLHVGNTKAALTILEKMASLAHSAIPRTREKIVPKIERLKTRVNLLNRPFPLSGFDVTGKPIGADDNEQTIIMFYDPFQQQSVEALRRVAASPLREGWETTTYLVSTKDTTEQEVIALKKLDRDFVIVDEATAQQWVEKSGVEKLPYLIILDAEGTVQRMRFP